MPRKWPAAFASTRTGSTRTPTSSARSDWATGRRRGCGFDLERVARAIGHRVRVPTQAGTGRPRGHGLPAGVQPDRGPEGPAGSELSRVGLPSSPCRDRGPAPSGARPRLASATGCGSRRRRRSCTTTSAARGRGGPRSAWRPSASTSWPRSTGASTCLNAQAAPRAREGEVPTFQVFASIVLERKRRRVAAKRPAEDLEWRLRTAMDHFGPVPARRDRRGRSRTTSSTAAARARGHRRRRPRQARR